MHMVKFCPHDLFVNTRADLGVCSRLHDDEAKSQFEKSTSYKKQQYEDDFVRFCQGMVSEVERKISKGKSRLALIGKADSVSINISNLTAVSAMCPLFLMLFLPYRLPYPQLRHNETQSR